MFGAAFGFQRKRPAQRRAPPKPPEGASAQRQPQPEKLIIIGSGCAGLSAAIYAARAGLEPLVIEGAQPGGQLTTTDHVENFPGFPEGISGPELVRNMRRQAEKFGARFRSDRIRRLEFSAEGKSPRCGRPDVQKCLRGETENLWAQTVIVAVGATPRKLGIPGEEKFFGGRGVSTCATCDGAFYRHREVVVVGGGDTACEDALFLARFCSRVHLVHRRDQLRASKIMAERVMAHEKISILWNSIPLRLEGDERLVSLQIRHGETPEEKTLPCSAVFLAIGQVPNTAPFHDALPLDERGYIRGDGVKIAGWEDPQRAFQGIFRAGDCADPSYRQAITAAAMGCQAALEAERTLVG
ncbi:MAG: thioredoxin-disulfide reductase [Puniceicoccales bacterium]|jgi:thioredoxin reductase (NADPH)|nr:thioredoxin-disulfide reductase [Puniceicoccales bacterium]